MVANNELLQVSLISLSNRKRSTIAKIGTIACNEKLLKDNKNNIVKVDDKGKDSILEYKVIATKDDLSLVDISLITGRSHQIRVQFSSRGNPLYGDLKYNPNAKVGEQIALFAYQLTIIHPTSKEQLVFELPKPKRYPFNLF